MQVALPQGVLDLLQTKVGSFEELELLLLLFRDRNVSWSASAVATHLGMDADLAAEALARVHAAGLLEKSSRKDGPIYSYVPRAPELDQAVADLAIAYDGRRLEVIRILNEHAVSRLRLSALRMFSDSFVIGGKKKDG